MSKKIRIILTALVLFTIPLAAQVNTSSPYSRFGLGELNQPGFAQNLAMGGTGIGMRNPSQINYLNPASYSAIDTMSFLFDFGLNGSQTKYTTTTQSSKLTNYNIHHIAMGFGITKHWKASVGIVPYSSVGYYIVENKFLPNIGLTDYQYVGSGGLNKLYFGNSVSFLNHFSVGLNLSYLFGYLNYKQNVSFPGDKAAAETNIQNRLNIGDISYNLGFQYYDTFNDKYFLTLGAVFDNKSNLKTSQKLIETTLYPGSVPANADSINPVYTVKYEDHAVQTLIPRNLGLGFSFGIKNKLTFAGDYSTMEWSKSEIPGKTDTLVNSSSLNLGIEYTPNDQALQGYLKKVHYRVGGYYTNNYLQIHGEQLKDYGLSIGLGLPFKGNKTSFNLGFIIGQRGTVSKGLIKENYGIVNFGLTLHDFWFFKRKFD
jgi:hypothetical protein